MKNINFSVSRSEYRSLVSEQRHGRTRRYTTSDARARRNRIARWRARKAA